jgi:hypothetical protein
MINKMEKLLKEIFNIDFKKEKTYTIEQVREAIEESIDNFKSNRNGLININNIDIELSIGCGNVIEIDDIDIDSEIFDLFDSLEDMVLEKLKETKE